MTPTTKGKLEELGYKVVRTSSYFYVHNIEDNEVIKICHGFKSLTGWVSREYKKKIG